MTFQFVHDGVAALNQLRRGSPAEEILDAVRKENVSMVALSTHGRTGMARWALGSVAEKVLQACPVPVLAVRAAERAVSRGRLERLPFREILVALAGSEASLQVLPRLLEFARPMDATLRLLHVCEPSPYAGRWAEPDEPLERAARTAREACIPATLEIRRGDPAEEILKSSEERPTDLIAMATHGRSGPSLWAFGSVTSKVLRGATAPMMVVRETSGAASRGDRRGNVHARE